MHYLCMSALIQADREVSVNAGKHNIRDLAYSFPALYFSTTVALYDSQFTLSLAAVF